jgi:hypothetical protein
VFCSFHAKVREPGKSPMLLLTDDPETIRPPVRRPASVQTFSSICRDLCMKGAANEIRQTGRFRPFSF